VRILTRYMVSQFLKILAICLSVFVSVYLIVDFLQKIDNFIEAGIPRSVMLSYFFYKTPHIIEQMLPPATLISVIVLLSIMRKHREITAMKACGLNLVGVFRGLVAMALLLSAGAFLFSEVVVQHANARTKEIWNYEVEKRDRGKYYYGYDQIWYRGEDRIYWIWSFDPETNVMEHPTFYFFDDDFHLQRKVGGHRGVWEDGVWVILRGYQQIRQPDGGYRTQEFDILRMDLPETPETFVRPVKQPEEMGYWGLKRYASRVKAEGYDNTRYLVDMHVKLAFPFIILIMALIGIPVPLIQKRVRTPLAVSLGMGIGFLYMLTFGFSRSLGLSGVLPPVLSAWLANLVFLLFGVYLLSLVER
jgi:lipopolysaccharide export system permease protein